MTEEDGISRGARELTQAAEHWTRRGNRENGGETNGTGLGESPDPRGAMVRLGISGLIVCWARILGISPFFFGWKRKEMAGVESTAQELLEGVMRLCFGVEGVAELLE